MEGFDASVNNIKNNKISMFINGEEYTGNDYNSIAINLIESNNIEKLVKHISEFKNLSQEIAFKLIEAGKGSSVIEHIENFNNIYHSKISLKLIESNYVSELCNSLYKLENLDIDLALKLIHLGRHVDVCVNLNKFENIDFNIIANEIIDIDKGYTLAKYLYNFKNLDSSIAYKLIDYMQGASVFEESLNSFNNLDINKLCNYALDAGIPYYVSKNLHKFNNLEENIALRLINENETHRVLENIENFNILNSTEFIIKIIESDQSYHVNYALDKLSDFNSEKVVLKLLEYSHHDLIYDNLDILEISEVLYSLITSDLSYDAHFSTVVINQSKKHGYEYIQNNYYSLVEESLIDDPYINEEDKDVLRKFSEISQIEKSKLGKLLSNIPPNDIHFKLDKFINLKLKMSVEGLLNPNIFLSNFIDQIIMDSSMYGSENNIDSVEYLVLIMEAIQNIDYNEVFNEAEKYPVTEDLVRNLKINGPYYNWLNLKKFYELNELLKEKDVLDKLSQFKENGQIKHYDFFTKLAFHPTSKVSMQTVISFMENPGDFLDINDEHAVESSERKKPSNYTQFPHLDLSEFDLRDVLVEGHLDDLQFFKPYEKNIKIISHEFNNKELVDKIFEGVGYFKEKIPGKAQSPKKLFAAINKLFIDNGLNIKDVKSNPELINEIKTELENTIFDSKIGLIDNRKLIEYRVRLHAKSSPDGHLAGNDTACCMPFGSGKNNNYMYNLGCATMTVERKSGNNYRTVAQSVLTPNIHLNKNISDIVQIAENEDQNLSDILPEETLDYQKTILTADNIEVSPNYKDPDSKAQIVRAYKNFVKEYIENFADELDIWPDFIIIGKGYNDLKMPDTQNVYNSFLPRVPVAYSDNYGPEALKLEIGAQTENDYELENDDYLKLNQNITAGAKDLDYRDTVRVSYMEGKVYSENESLVQYIHRIGNELTAAEINNKLKDRPNLSIKYEDSEGRLKGYMIAYEGLEDKENLESTAIYISDLASDPESKVAGGKIIKEFVKRLEDNYYKKGNKINIIAEARDTTSYRIILKHLDKLGEKYNVKYKLEELGDYYSGDDLMHQVRLIAENSA